VNYQVRTGRFLASTSPPTPEMVNHEKCPDAEPAVERAFVFVL